MKRKLYILNILALLFVANIMIAQQSKTLQPTPANKAMANVPDKGCTGKDTFAQGVRIVPRPNWKDSYQANGFCFCKSSFDHGVGNFKININGRGRNIKDICDELKKHPSYRNLRNSDPTYNTIQCGNEPGHGDAITIKGKKIKDEKVCPGRVDKGSKGCQCKGPKFDMNWLRSRPRFGGNGGGGGGENSGNVTILGQTINKYVSSEGGTVSMRATRNAAGNREKFVVASAGNGTVSFKGSNGKYVSSENGKKAMNCNRNTVGSWEKFRLESLGGNLYAIKGNNGKYVSHENGKKAINCNRNTVGTWERFVIKGLDANRLNDIVKESAAPYTISVYPTPMNSDNANITLSLPKKVTYASIEIIDLKGNRVSQRNLGSMESGTRSIPLNNFQKNQMANGLYIIKVRLDDKVLTKKVTKQ